MRNFSFRPAGSKLIVKKFRKNYKQYLFSRFLKGFLFTFSQKFNFRFVSAIFWTMALLPSELFTGLMDCMNIELNQRRKLFVVHLLTSDNELITDFIMRSRALGGYHLLNAVNKKHLIKVNEKWSLKKCFEVHSMDSKHINKLFKPFTLNILP